ncbi:MAG: penicillinase repressor [Candidatus Tectimicrobiota bacterium]|nr:MAG: penicillinase repressor [Candidatus Tectomicrobia bacterium]
MAARRRRSPVFRPQEKGLRKVFGELEAAVMEWLWAHGAGTVGDVYQALAGQRELAYTTVKTVMERLAAKGYLRCDKRQRAYLYTPVQSREAFLRQVGKAVVGGLLRDFGAPLAAHLLEETVRQCDLETLERLQALIEARRAAQEPGQ